MLNQHKQLQIFTQNTTTGELYDISTVTEKVNIATKRRGTPAKLEIDVIDNFELPEGSYIAVRAGDMPIFYGRLFRIRKRKNNRRTFVCFDSFKYLLRKETYVFRNQTVTEIIKAIAKDFQIEVGAMKAPTIKLPHLLKEDKSALDIIEECIDDILIRTGEVLVFWDEFGKLRLDSPKNMAIGTILGEDSIITDYEYESSIEDSSNTVKLSQENPDDGSRTIYVFKDEKTIKNWGILQHFQVIDEKTNVAQAKEIGTMLLDLRNKPKQTVSLSFSVGDFNFRAGKAVYVDLAELKLKGWYVLETVTHDVKGSAHKMDVTLWMSDTQS